MDKKLGYDIATWDAARAEMRDILSKRAAHRFNQTISYSDLCREVKAIRFEAWGPALAHMLGEISTSEAEAGRGMLTVIVVHKSGDMKPGPGFPKLAAELGRDVSDLDVLWINEFNLVTNYWRKHFAA